LPDGLIIPQRSGYEELPPNGELTFRLNMNQRFRPTRRPGQEKWEARVAIVSSPCSASTVGESRLSWSAWTNIRY
jgi:hypothetical protein